VRAFYQVSPGHQYSTVRRSSPLPPSATSTSRFPVLVNRNLSGVEDDLVHTQASLRSDSLSIRNCIFFRGNFFPVLAVQARGFETCRFGFVCLSRNVEVLGPQCFGDAAVHFFTLEPYSHLRTSPRDCFAFVAHLVSVSICAIQNAVLESRDHLTSPADSRVAIGSDVERRDDETAVISVVGEGDSPDAIESVSFSYPGFINCASLAYISVPDDVYIVGKGCFESCKSLRGVIFESPSKLARIDSCAFARCPSLRLIRTMLPFMRESSRGSIRIAGRNMSD
jgi:hypothetical protein